VPVVGRAAATPMASAMGKRIKTCGEAWKGRHTFFVVILAAFWLGVSPVPGLKLSASLPTAEAVGY
jgi:hypothetical protein